MNGKEIKKKRVDIGLSQEELGSLVGMSKNTIYNYENGGKIPTTKIPILVKFFENYNPNTVSESDKDLSLSKEGVTFTETEVVDWVFKNFDALRENNKYFDLVMQDVETKAVSKFLEDQGIKVEYK